MDLDIAERISLSCPFTHKAKSCGLKLPFFLQARTISQFLMGCSNKVGCCIRETYKSNICVCVFFLLGEPPLLQVDTDGDNSLSSSNSPRDNIKGHAPGPSADIIHSHSLSDVSPPTMWLKMALNNDVLTITYCICFCLARYVSRLTGQISMQSIDFLCIFLS